jgi:16S rRNA (guanine527-N7)-methyltransferase
LPRPAPRNRSTDPDAIRARLSEGLLALTGREPAASLVERLAAYLALLDRWNRVHNLTAVRDPAEMVSAHVLDSLALLPWVDEEGQWLDVGSGAGLPGVPLALARPRLEVTLIDSVEKKVRFLRHVARELPVANIHPVAGRVEHYLTAVRFDAIVSRAFASISDFVRAVTPLADARTHLYAMKGRYPESELASLPDAVRIDAVETLDVPGLKAQRHLVIMSLRASTTGTDSA